MKTVIYNLVMMEDSKLAMIQPFDNIEAIDAAIIRHAKRNSIKLHGVNTVGNTIGFTTDENYVEYMVFKNRLMSRF